MERYGIDVSSHNGKIDWTKVKTDFAILRAGWSWYEGGMNIDTRFLDNIKGVQENSIPYGIYIYAYDKSVNAAIIAANRLADLLDKYKFGYPVWYDIEDNQYIKMPKATNTAITKAFLETIQSRGYYTGLYTYYSFAKSFLNMDELSQYDFWCANYTGKVGWEGSYGMWQNSAKGKVAGISTDVDTNICYRDYPTIIKESGLNGYDKVQNVDKDILDELNKVKLERDSLAKEVKELKEKLMAIKEIIE